jgi:hypothetical protein
MSREIVSGLSVLLVINTERHPEPIHTNKDCAPGSSVADKPGCRTHDVVGEQSEGISLGSSRQKRKECRERCQLIELK